jgi:hypothetical protein
MKMQEGAWINLAALILVNLLWAQYPALFGLILSAVTVHDHLMLPQILGGALTPARTATLTLFEGRRSAHVAASSSN